MTKRQIETLINREILANQTLLVEYLLKDSNYLEQIENLYDEGPETVEEFLLYADGLSEKLSELEIEDVDQLDQFEKLDLAQELGFESMPQEIYEWWLVTDWLADKLSEFYEPILRTDFGTWWGRTTTGQSIKLDQVIQKVIAVTDYAKFGN